MKVLIAVPFLLLALLGAGGMSSLENDDFCSMHYRAVPGSEGVLFGTELTLRPPGWRCTDEGRPTEITTGSWPRFFIALAGALAAGRWYLRRRSRSARFAFASTTALAVAGAFGWYGGWQFGFMLGLFFSVPVGWLAGGRDPATGLAAGAAVFVTACFTLWYGDDSAVLGCYVAIALVATTALAAARVARLRPAR